ncbi:hypothetical protein BDZ97DRAFT_1929508 [Flammula alnicola]|nr:hypothetical protein BDZ97DRAFT_1929508 [Flammula alnicola]
MFVALWASGCFRLYSQHFDGPSLTITILTRYNGHFFSNVPTGQEQMEDSSHPGTRTAFHASKSGPYIPQHSTENQLEPVSHRPHRPVNLPQGTSYIQNHPSEYFEQDPRIYYDNIRYDIPDRGETFRNSRQPSHVENFYRVTGGHNFAQYQTPAHHAHVPTSSQVGNNVHRVSPAENNTLQPSRGASTDVPRRQWNAFVSRDVHGEAVCQWNGSCGAVFQYEGNYDLMEHLRDHHRVLITTNVENPCLWKGCKSTVEYLGVNLPIHVRNVHLGVNRMACILCDMNFSCKAPATFKKHLTDVHPEVSWF